MLKRVFAALGALMALSSIALAGNVPLITGPQDPSQLYYWLNTIIVSGNTDWSPAGSGFNNANSIKANGSVAISAIGSAGPTGAAATVGKWMKVQDNTGATYVIPMWSCPTC